MKRTTVTIVLLSLALAGTNAYWAYHFVDAAVSYSDLETSYRDARGTALQALTVLPTVANPSASRESIVGAAASASRVQVEPFEKDGYVWVGDLGLRFDGSGRLVEAKAAVDPL